MHSEYTKTWSLPITTLSRWRIEGKFRKSQKQLHLNQRLPQAVRAPLPAIEAFLAPFHMQFRQRKGTENLERYVTGLLNEHPNKNCETPASRCGMSQSVTYL
jgi:hypothetical protein